MNEQEQIRRALQTILDDKYEIGPWIGGGGMAEVFLAKHRLQGGLFAVKVLAPQLAREERIVARFSDEARTAGTLSGHANIVAVFDIGDAGGLHYLIMPYVEGQDVKGYLERRGRLSNEEAAFIIRQIAEALVWAGDRRVVHRDLKPANVRIDTSGRVMVLDFGIAKAQDTATGLTRTTETLGTPYYMSPEQITATPCDVRSDLYSLGIIFFELLTGARPFTGETHREIEAGHLHKAPPSIAALSPGVDPALEGIVYRLLEKRPEDRFQDARAVIAALRATAPGQADVRLRAEKDFAGWAGSASPAPSRERGSSPSSAPPQPGPPPPEIKAPRARPAWLLPVALLGTIAAIGVTIVALKNSANQGTYEREPDAPRGLERVLRTTTGAMYLVPPGKFIFGDGDPTSPNPRQEVDLAAYYMDVTEVANETYARFARETQRPAPPMDQPTHPVTGVTFDEAQAFCQWAGKRLPTEQEWEKAGRGHKGWLYPWGNSPLDHPGKLTPVDEYPERQGPFGHLALAGNVYEWTSQPFPVGDAEIADMEMVVPGKKVTREWYAVKGGSFLQKDERFFRLYMRRGWPRDMGAPLIGIRCAQDANATEKSEDTKNAKPSEGKSR